MDNVLKCRKCRRILPVGAIYCCWCGILQDESKAPQRGKKRKRAAGSGTIKKLPGNRAKPYQACLPLSMGGKPIGTFATYAEADKTLALEVATRPASSRVEWTVEDFYNFYISTDKFQSLGEKGTKKTFPSSWKYCEIIKNMKMRDCNAMHWQRCIDAAIAQGKSESTSRKIREVASALCKEAMKDNIITQNYSLLLDIGGTKKKELDTFTAAEIKKLQEHDTDKRIMFILILIYTGLRIGELLKLDVADAKGDYIVGGSKTEAGTDRIIPIIGKVRPYFDFFISGRESGPLFMRTDTEPLLYEYAKNKWFYAALDEIGINTKDADGNRRITPHYARHSFATLAQIAGVSDDALKSVIGHTSISTTQRIYVDKHNQDYIKAKAAKLSGEIGKLNGEKGIDK